MWWAQQEKGVEDFGKAPDRVGEFVEVGGAVRVELNLGEDMRVEADLAPVDDRDALLDEAVAFEAVDAAPAGRHRQADALGDLRRRLIRVKLHFSDNFYLERVLVSPIHPINQ